MAARGAGVLIKNEWRTGWKLVLAASLGMGTSGPLLMMVSGTFIQPMQRALGWPRAWLALGAIFSLAGASTLPFVGFVVERWGVRFAGMFGLAAFGLCMFGLAFLASVPVAFFTVLILMGAITFPLTCPAVFTAGFADHFIKGRGSALGVSLSGYAFLAILLLPVTGWLIEQFGWRAGFFVIGTAAIIIGIPSTFFLMHPRENQVAKIRSAQRLIDKGEGTVSIARALRTPRFWLAICSVVSAALPVGGIVASTQPILVENGFPLHVAGAFGSAYAGAIVVGRLIGGVLLDRLWAPGVAAVFLVAPAMGAAGILHLTPGTPYWIGVGAMALLGLGQGAETDCIAFFTARLFPIELYAKLMGVMLSAVFFAVAAGGLAFGAAFDHWGTYRPAIWAAVGFYLLAATLFLSIGLIRQPGNSVVEVLPPAVT